MGILGYIPKDINAKPRDWRDIDTDAENAWRDGKNADANPYNKDNKPIHWRAWHNAWYQCNVNC